MAVFEFSLMGAHLGQVLGSDSNGNHRQSVHPTPFESDSPLVEVGAAVAQSVDVVHPLDGQIAVFIEDQHGD